MLHSGKNESSNYYNIHNSEKPFNSRFTTVKKQIANVRFTIRNFSFSGVNTGLDGVTFIVSGLDTNYL